VDGGEARRVAVFQALSMSRLRTAHFATMIAVGTQAQGRAHQVGEVRDAGLGTQRDTVRGGALQLACVLQEDDTIARVGDLGEEGMSSVVLPEEVPRPRRWFLRSRMACLRASA